MITDQAEQIPTRERILDAAVRLFGSKGYGATSVGEIEAAAGLVPRSGALYKHFASKRALLEAVVSRRAQVAADAGEQAAALLAGDIRTETRGVGYSSLKIVRDDQPLLRLVMREGDNFPELREAFGERIVGRGQATLVGWLGLAAARARALDGGPDTAAGGAPREPGAPDLDALASLILGSIINYCVLTTLLGSPPGGVSEERFLDTWTDSTIKLLEAHGLAPDITTLEAPA